MYSVNKNFFFLTEHLTHGRSLYHGYVNPVLNVTKEPGISFFNTNQSVVVFSAGLSP
jgi:hypothetical protein